MPIVEPAAVSPPSDARSPGNEAFKPAAWSTRNASVASGSVADPAIADGAVRFPAGSLFSRAKRANPKSRILTRPARVTIKFCGLMSRWTIPFS